MASRKAIGFVGVDEFSLEMAFSAIRHGYDVQAFQINSPVIEDIVKLGGVRCSSPSEAGRDVTALVILISHIDQTNDLIFGDEGALRGLKPDTVLILRSTILPSLLHKLERDLAEIHEIAYVVDAYVSYGRSDDLNEKVIIASSGSLDAIARAQPVLSAMCEKLFTFEGEIGGGSKVKMVNVMLEGIHFINAVEALSLGAKIGIHPWIIYDIISNAAGNSWAFKNYLPLLLKGEVNHQILNTFVKELEIILNMSKSLTFPLPILAATHLQLIHGVSLVDSGDDVAAPIKVWEKVYGVNISDAEKADTYNPEQLASEFTTDSKSVRRVGFIGLGAMGFGMATHLLSSEFCVVGYDVYEPTQRRFTNAGGLIGNSPAEVSKDVDVLIIMVTNESQAENVLYGENGAVSALPAGASIILSSTVSPAYVSQLEHRLHDKYLKLVDAPVSGGVTRASLGTLTIMASGTDDALKSAGQVLAALSEKLYIIKGGCGSGSGIKMINQLLAGVHIASAAEAIAFAARLGLNTRLLFDFIAISGGTSWMFENRGQHMIDNDYTPCSALDIFVKDMGIVTRESSAWKVPLQLSTIAHQLYLAGSAAGWGRIDDAGVVKVYEMLTGVRVEGKIQAQRKDAMLHSLPPEWPEDHVLDIQTLKESNSKILVVLDDDPTGTQTVHDIEVLTEWTIESLVEQFRKSPKCFFILTNSRSLSSDKASALIKEICRNLDIAAKSIDSIDYSVVLRGDSTLRGHFPEEADAVVSVLGEMDAWIICPFFLQGGRYTIADTHYVDDSDTLVPAGDTEFAKDASFGYKSSNLRHWVEEKTNGRILASSVASVSIQLLRKGGPNAVAKHLCSLQKGTICVVNAASERDMTVFALGMIKAELTGKRFLCRTAASFVSALMGIISKPPILPSDLGIAREKNGGLIVVGSYVPKTTKQVEELKLQCGQFLKSIEVSVEKLAMSPMEEREEEISRTAELADLYLKVHKDTLIMTSRNLITGRTAAESLDINFKVSSALVEIVKRVTTKPRYIIAKGGITSSDLATKALGARCAKIVGQALAGVPLWQLGPESRHPGIPYIVFPGNVGNSTALAEVVKSWTYSIRFTSTKEILNNAEKGGYAVGAFNVYNLEGAEAVVSAAEEEQSPAILQIHPGALKQGGIPLVACCISAAKQASVPITVHFDHGTLKQDLVEALDLGFSSIMVDGSHLSFNENVAYTQFITLLAHSKNMLVEAELGRLSGTEDDLTVEEFEARLTDVNMASKFIDETGIDALAVCIGNVHGKYPASGPNLRVDLLKELHALSLEKGVHLVLHGASGLSEELVKECINLGVRKFNVNTEVRKAYMDSLITPKNDLVHVMASAKEAMKAVVADDVDDATKHIFVEEDLQHESAFDNKVFASKSPVSLESENTVDSFNAYGFRDFDSNPTVDTAESTANLKENVFNVDPGDLLNHDGAKPPHINTVQNDEITSSSGSVSFGFTETYSGSGADNETEIVSVVVNPESNDTISDPKVFNEAVQENILSASKEENLDLNKIPQVSAEGNEPSLEEWSIPGNDVYEKSSVLSSANTLVDEQVINDNYEVDEVKSESPNFGSFFSVPGIPAPSVVSSTVQVFPGKVLVPAAVDQVQGQALAALQVLKVIEPHVQPSDLCTRREYARWLVSASSTLSRSTVSKVYPAMYIDNVTELAFDDVTPEDPDFSSIQGLAEAGLIESRLSRQDIQLSGDEDDDPFYFSPGSPLSRQDLVSWKMALEKRQLPEADRKTLYQLSGFLDTDKIHPNACPALVADLSAGEHGIIALAFGYTRLFQPDKPVTKAQAAMALATGEASEIVSEELARIEAESIAENAVAAHSALVAQVEKDINASFEQQLFIEREKISAVEKMAEEARLELERLRAEREGDNLALTKERAAIDSEMEVFSKLRHEVEDQLQILMNDKVEIAHEKERITKLREQAEVENKEISRLQYELEVERKALSMARAWAEDEAKRVREQAIALEEARDRWERHGIKVVVDDDLRKEASAGVTWLNASEQISVQGTVDRAENLLDKLKLMASDIRGKSRDILDKIIHMVSQFISKLREWASTTGKHAEEFGEAAISKVGKSASELQQSAIEVGFGIKEGTKRVAGDCREGVEKITQKFTQKFKT